MQPHRLKELTPSALVWSLRATGDCVWRWHASSSLHSGTLMGPLLPYCIGQNSHRSTQIPGPGERTPPPEGRGAAQAMAFQAFVLRCQCPVTLLVDFYTPTLSSEHLGTFLSLGVFSLLGVFARWVFFLAGLSVNQVRVLESASLGWEPGSTPHSAV